MNKQWTLLFKKIIHKGNPQSNPKTTLLFWVIAANISVLLVGDDLGEAGETGDGGTGGEKGAGGPKGAKGSFR